MCVCVCDYVVVFLYNSKKYILGNILFINFGKNVDFIFEKEMSLENIIIY